LKSINKGGNTDSTAIASDTTKNSFDSARRKSQIVNRMKPVSEKKKELTEFALKNNRIPVAAAIPKAPNRYKAFDSLSLARIDSVFDLRPPRDAIQGAANTARQVKSQITNSTSSIENYRKELTTFQVQWHKIWASSFACIAMFLIGAPLGAIIKKGGLGVPFLVSIFFFIIYYVFTMQGEKLAKQGNITVATGVWMADTILFCVGLLFLRQARVDARLFEADFYSVVSDKIKRWLSRKKQARLQTG